MSLNGSSNLLWLRICSSPRWAGWFAAALPFLGPQLGRLTSPRDRDSRGPVGLFLPLLVWPQGFCTVRSFCGHDVTQPQGGQSALLASAPRPSGRRPRREPPAASQLARYAARCPFCCFLLVKRVTGRGHPRVCLRGLVCGEVTSSHQSS